MQCKMVVSRAMFDFQFSEKGRLRLESVRFLTDSMMCEKNDVLLVSEEDTVNFFLNGSVSLSSLSRAQVRFVAAAARFFGHLPGNNKMPVWLWSGSMSMNSKMPQRIETEAAMC